MPKRKKEAAVIVTARSRKFRARQRQRDLIAEHDAVFALDLQAVYASRHLASDVWIPVREFISRYSPQVQTLLVNRRFAETETSVAVIGGAVVDLIRPKFLPGEMENKKWTLTSKSVKALISLKS